LGTYWIGHRKRRGYEGVDLVPNAPQELPDGKLNLWRGFDVEPRKGDWPLLAQHVVTILANGDPKAAEYILRWIAWCLQHPGVRGEVALVLQGGKGSGKGVLVRAVARCFGEHGMQIINQEHLVGRFNGHLRSCLFLFADEAFWAGDKRGESVLKGLITEPTIIIEQKGIDAVQWPNRLHVAMAANAEWVVPASAGERRYAVFKCADTYVRGHCDEEVSKAYFKALHHELGNGGLEAMLYDLLNWDLGDWHPRQIYETAGLRQQKELSLPPIAEWFVLVLEDGKLPGLSPSRAGPAALREYLHRHRCRNWALPGSNRCRLHGGHSTGPRTFEGKSRTIAAMNEGRARWLAELKAEGKPIPWGRKKGGRNRSPAERKQAAWENQCAREWREGFHLSRDARTARQCQDRKDAAADMARLERFHAGGPFWTDEEWEAL
jgi:hypothetical protein